MCITFNNVIHNKTWNTNFGKFSCYIRKWGIHHKECILVSLLIQNRLSYIAIRKSLTVSSYIPSTPINIIIILDQDIFSIEAILCISVILRTLTTSDEDGLRIGLSRIPEISWKVPQNDLSSQNRILRNEITTLVRSPILLLRGQLIESTQYKLN